MPPVLLCSAAIVDPTINVKKPMAEMQTPDGLVHLLSTVIQEQHYDEVPRLYAIETKVTGVDSTEVSFFRYNPHDGKLLRYRIVDRRWQHDISDVIAVDFVVEHRTIKVDIVTLGNFIANILERHA